MSRIARRLPGREFNENDIIEWCQVVELDILGNVDGMFRFSGWKLPVSHGRARLPCNVWRILELYLRKGDPGSAVPFNRLPGAVCLDPMIKAAEVYIDYVGVPIDTHTGIPLIQSGHEEACAAYCIYMMHYEAGINGHIPATTLQMLKQDMQAEILAASSNPGIQHKTLRQLNDLMACAYDLTPYPAAMKLVTGKFV